MRIAGFPSHLDSNPYCDLLYGHLRDRGIAVEEGVFSFGWLWRRRGSVSVLHFHWIERYYTHWRGGPFTYVTLIRFVLFVLCAKLLSYEIVWTMHNASPHESKTPLADRLAVIFMACFSKVVVHCENAGKLLRSMALARNMTVIPHGNYISVYPKCRSREEARKLLGVGDGEKVFLYFGLVRFYKGIGELCDAFASLGAREATLIVAGRPYERGEEAMLEVMREKYSSKGIRFIPHYIPDAEVGRYFAAADFSVFPYRDVLTSGSVILALGFGCPVIVPAIGCLAELRDAGVGIVYDPDEEGALRRAMMSAVAHENRGEMSDRCVRYAESLRWDDIAEKYLRFLGR